MSTTPGDMAGEINALNAELQELTTLLERCERIESANRRRFVSWAPTQTWIVWERPDLNVVFRSPSLTAALEKLLEEEK